MVVEPESLCWAEGRKVARRDGATWAATFAAMPALRSVICDAGTGLSKGLKLARAARRRDGVTTPLDQTLDVFHTPREGRRAPGATWRRAAGAMERAGALDRVVTRRMRAGRTCKGYGASAAASWRRAERLWDQAAAAEAAWDQARQALALFTAEGRLATRPGAEATLAEAMPRLAGPEWAKARRLLARPEALGFLDLARERLAATGLPAEVLAAATELEGLARRPGPADATTRCRALIRSVQLARSGVEGRDAVARVRRALRGAWRASSLVECLNSVARMQQARHREVTQGLLDLKRLYWNCRAFRTGRRRGKAPYELLGLDLPTSDWWELLKIPPERLRHLLSATQITS